MPYAIETKQKA